MAEIFGRYGSIPLRERLGMDCLRFDPGSSVMAWEFPLSRFSRFLRYLAAACCCSASFSLKFFS